MIPRKIPAVLLLKRKRMTPIRTAGTITSLLCILLLLLIGPPSGLSQPQQRTIALFSPGASDNPFWSQIIEVTRAACNDLNLTLEVYHGDDDHLIMLEQMKKAAKREDSPDAFMFPNVKKAGIQFVEIAEQHQITSFVFNMSLNIEETGAPREQYGYWIGQMTPDDEKAGYELGKALIAKAEDHSAYGSDGKIHIIGLSGRTTDNAAILRNSGLQRAADEAPNAVLDQIVPTNWTSKQAQNKYRGLSRRYPEINVIWMASNNMALGILDLLKEKNLVPNRDVFLGGVDWTREGLDAVVDGHLTAAAGGHSLEGGWVAVLLYDYLHGYDFVSESTVMKTPMDVLTADNIDRYYSLFGEGNYEQIDFRAFSKALNPELNSYDFSINQLLRQQK